MTQLLHPRHWYGWLIGLLPERPPATEEDLRAFDVHRREQDFRNWRLMLVFSAVCTVLWWPTDLVLLSGLTATAQGPSAPNAIEHFAWARGIAAAVTIGLVLSAQLFPIVRRNALVVFGAGGLFVCLFAGFQFGFLGGPDEPWFHFGHFVVLPPIGITMRPWVRFGVTFAFAAAFSIGFFGLHPAHLGAPLTGASLNYLAFAVVFAHVAGVATDRMRFRAFILWRTSERQAGELRAFKEDLERRVDARTSEVRLLLKHMESAREAERSRLARELHDELGQELTAIRYAVELARRRHSVDPASIATNLAEIESLLQRARLATRDVVSELRPHVLDDLGLSAAAELLTRRTAERTGLVVEFEREGREAAAQGLEREGADREVTHGPSFEVGTAGYRILQECLTNVARHAGATRVAVSLKDDQDSLVLRVADDGTGFDVRAMTPGFGLLGMRERAAALGIALTIDSAPGAGTRVTARLPLPAAKGGVA